MLRATWFIKMTSAYNTVISEAKNKKRSLGDPSIGKFEMNREEKNKYLVNNQTNTQANKQTSTQTCKQANKQKTD